MDTGEITVGEQETLRISRLLEEGGKLTKVSIRIVTMRMIRRIRLVRMARERGKGKKEMGMGMDEVELSDLRVR